MLGALLATKERDGHIFVSYHSTFAFSQIKYTVQYFMHGYCDSKLFMFHFLMKAGVGYKVLIFIYTRR